MAESVGQGGKKDMSSINSIIKKIERLTPIPQVASKVMSIAEDPKSSMSDLSKIIVYDTAVTANLLKVVNSAYFGLPEKVDSVHQAIVYLGMSQVVDLVLLSASGKNLQTAQEGYDLKAGELWKYSVSSALIAREIAEKKGVKDTHLIFTAALLKDIGKVILNQYVKDSFEKINALVTKQNFTFREAEKEVIGIDHAELGGMVAENWKFSPKMVEIIRHHHRPQETSMSEFESAIVYMADTICMMMGIGVGSDGLAYRFHREVVESLELTETEFQKMVAGFVEKIGEIEAMINV
ncbi:MAG: HDOD domain-containing protein [Desulfobacterales bacterium]|jgi:putative nucleotidyltransferase with HDIG domain